MKFAFYKHEELNQILTQLLKSEANDIQCEVGFSEDLDGDCVEIYENGKLAKVVELKEVFDVLSQHLGEEITRHDVMEVGDFGEGFLFFFKDRVVSTKPKFKAA